MAAAGGGAVWAVSSKKISLLHGTNFSIHIITDENFCLETEGDGTILVSQCAVRDNQHWTFTENPDNTHVIVDGDGLCLDRGTGALNTPVTSVPCTFGPSERFVYTTTGKFQQPGGTTCIAVSAAAQNAPVFNSTCGGTKDVKVFQLSH
jgi:hypothetical protein